VHQQLRKAVDALAQQRCEADVDRKRQLEVDREAVAGDEREVHHAGLVELGVVLLHLRGMVVVLARGSWWRVFVAYGGAARLCSAEPPHTGVDAGPGLST
jgi:hypothetical protein